MSSLTSNTYAETLLDVARSAADQASKTSLSYFKNQVKVDYKSDESPVTVADRETESVLREIIGEGP